MSTSSSPALTVDGLGLQIGGARILEDVSFTVGSGEIVGVIGPNGAGKTTLFNLISGVLRPTEGAVRLNGRNVTTDSIHRRAQAGLGRTFQTSSLFPRLSVLENVRFAAQTKLGRSLSLLKFPHADDEGSAIAKQMITEVGLWPRSTVAAGDLSHGDKRKLEIAMLLATEPAVILLDEPMAGVVSGDVPGLSAIIASLHRDHGCTVMMVEHHMEVVLGLVQRVASEAIASLPAVLRIPLSEPLFILGTLFILVVLFMPGGIAGFADRMRKRRGSADRRSSDLLEEAS